MDTVASQIPRPSVKKTHFRTSQEIKRRGILRRPRSRPVKRTSDQGLSRWSMQLIKDAQNDRNPGHILGATPHPLRPTQSSLRYGRRILKISATLMRFPDSCGWGVGGLGCRGRSTEKDGDAGLIDLCSFGDRSTQEEFVRQSLS